MEVMSSLLWPGISLHIEYRPSDHHSDATQQSIQPSFPLATSEAVDSRATSILMTDRSYASDFGIG